MSAPRKMTPADISVVIPTLNEAAGIGATVSSARRAGAEQIIITDGGSSDGTRHIAIEAGATQFVTGLAGRGIQLNAGAVFADRPWVLFLHADNQLGCECLKQICKANPPLWGCFGHRIDAPGRIYRWIESGNAMRARWRGMVFGDQGIFVRRQAFHRHGGFAEIPLMEDVDFSRRFRRIARPAVLPGPLRIDARRWERRGPVRQTWLNWRIQWAYAWGADPDSLRKRYR